MPIREGWELSPDRQDMFDKMMGMDPVGDPIITSKCHLGKDNGLLVVSNNGIAWRLKAGYSTSFYEMGKSKWVRWHDVGDLVPRKPGQLLAYIKLRKNGELKLDKKGNIKLVKWPFMVDRNKDEDKALFAQRKAVFNDVMLELFNQYRTASDPPTSDSRI